MLGVSDTTRNMIISLIEAAADHHRHNRIAEAFHVYSLAGYFCYSTSFSTYDLSQKSEYGSVGSDCFAVAQSLCQLHPLVALPLTFAHVSMETKGLNGTSLMEAGQTFLQSAFLKESEGRREEACSLFINAALKFYEALICGERIPNNRNIEIQGYIEARKKIEELFIEPQPMMNPIAKSNQLAVEANILLARGEYEAASRAYQQASKVLADNQKANVKIPSFPQNMKHQDQFSSSYLYSAPKESKEQLLYKEELSAGRAFAKASIVDYQKDWGKQPTNYQLGLKQGEKYNNPTAKPSLFAKFKRPK